MLRLPFDKTSELPLDDCFLPVYLEKQYYYVFALFDTKNRKFVSDSQQDLISYTK